MDEMHTRRIMDEATGLNIHNMQHDGSGYTLYVTFQKCREERIRNKTMMNAAALQAAPTRRPPGQEQGDVQMRSLEVAMRSNRRETGMQPRARTRYHHDPRRLVRQGSIPCQQEEGAISTQIMNCCAPEL